MKKKQPEYEGYNSYPLTPEQVSAALLVFEDDLLQDQQGDEKAGVLLMLFKSFAYTQDDTKREGMLIAAEHTLMPWTSAANGATKELSISTHIKLTSAGKGGQG